VGLITFDFKIRFNCILQMLINIYIKYFKTWK